LAGIAKRLGRKALQEIACIAQPDTILAWYRELVAEKFDGSKKRGLAGRPRVDAAIEALVVKLARENSGWGYDRIVGAVANLGHEISDQSVAISCGAMGSRPRRSVNKAQPGASSFTVLLSAHVRWVNRTLHGQRSLHKLRAENHNEPRTRRSVSEAARQMKVPRTSLSRWEHGHEMPRRGKYDQTPRSPPHANRDR